VPDDTNVLMCTLRLDYRTGRVARTAVRFNIPEPAPVVNWGAVATPRGSRG
jgi:hypothetical protein